MRILIKYLLFSVIVLAGYAQQPGEKKDALVIVVHKSNTVTNLNSEELRQIFLGERRHWRDGRKITLALPVAAQERQAALPSLTGMNDSEFKRHWLHITFTGEAQTGPRELVSAAGVKRFIFNVPGAIGIIRANELDDSVKAICIDGRAPGQADYKLGTGAER
jgi:hypothetical protein